MGYFSNGTEGETYRAEWCERCVHGKNLDCPIWAAHLNFNYAECNKPDSILHMLIPRTKDGLGNEQCRLFLEGDTTGDLFEGA